MPEIAVVAQTPVIAGVAPEALGGAGASDGEGFSAASFANILQQQLAGMATDALDAPLAALLGANGNEPAADSSLATLLPLLASQMASTSSGMPTDRQSDDAASLAMTDATMIAAPVMAAPATVTPVQATPIAAATTTSAAPPTIAAEADTAATKLSAGTPTAILAAGADVAAKTPAADNFQALLAANSETTATTPGAGASIPMAAQAATAHATANIAPTIATPVGAAGWDTEVGNRVAWMANNQVGRAELVLTPPHLGRIEISLTVSGDQATATFVSASPAVREAIENAVPRLREILADAGVTLGQTQVGADTPQQSAEGRDNDNPATRPVDRPAIAGLTTGTAGGTVWTTTGRGLVDVFA